MAHGTQGEARRRSLAREQGEEVERSHGRRWGGVHRAREPL